MSASNVFRRLVEDLDIIVTDGGMGTLLIERGLKAGGSPELLNVDHPEIIAGIHREYVAAGADIILTNTFGGNRIRLGHNQLADRVAELNTAAVAIARKVAAEFDRPVAVAGSIGPTGELFAPYGTLEPAAAVDVFAEQVTALYEAGVDVLWIETMSSIEEVEAAYNAASTTDLPVSTTMSFDTNGRTMMGVAPESLAEWAAAKPTRPAAVGANCGIGPDEAIATVRAIVAEAPEVAPVAKANCGLPYLDGDDIKYPLAPADMIAYTEDGIESGARIIGACCGSTPEHIAAIRAVVDTV